MMKKKFIENRKKITAINLVTMSEEKFILEKGDQVDIIKNEFNDFIKFQFFGITYETKCAI